MDSVPGLLIEDEASPSRMIAFRLIHDDGSDPVISVANKGEEIFDWLVIEDIQGEILKIDENFGITLGDNYQRRLSRVLVRNVPVSTSENDSVN